MLRTFLILFSVIFLATTPSVAQSSFFNVNETQPFKDTKRNTSLEQLFTLSNGQMVAVRSAKRRLMVSAFSSKYQIANDIEIELERKQSYLGSVQDGNSVHLFTLTEVDKRTKDINVHTYTAGNRSISTKKLYTATKDDKRLSKFGTLASRKHEENFRVSPNGEFIAFAIENIDSKTNAFSIRVFDNSLNEVYNTNYIDSEEKYYAFDDFIVSNHGEVLSAGKLYKKGRREKRKGEANYDYIVYRVSESGSDSFQFDLGDNFVKELSFAQSEDEDIRLIGFYSERNSRRMKGAVSYTFSGMDIQSLKATEVPFPETMFKDLYTEKKANRLAEKEKELQNYYLDYVLVDEEGNSYLLAEQFYVTYQTTGGGMNGMVTTRTIYHYDNILAIKFDAEGNLTWARSILKKDYAPSYNAFVLNNTLHVFLNSGKNLGEKSDGRTKVRRGFLEGSALYDISFDPSNGELDYQQIQENKGKETFIPYKGTFGDDAIVLPNLSKRKKSFLVLTQK
ncbi:MAG: hypothetical protein R3359_06155 [Marinirhabdus sp.]|nr:hypothetical protein [Marinirhabdus sp.]